MERRSLLLSVSLLLFLLLALPLRLSPVDAEVFLGKEILYQLEEEVPAGTKLADIMADAGLTKLYKAPEIRRMTLRFNSDPVIPLSIKNGVVRTSGRIDRESIPACKVRDPCELSVDVTVQPYEYFRVIKMIVEVLDINDNPPTFQVDNDDEDSAEISILESLVQGSSVALPSATDADSSRFGIAGYQLLMAAGVTTFHLKVSMKVEGILEACLVVNEKLDRETTPFYSATLVAYDGGTPTRSASLNLMIVIMDANDNDPTFERNFYEATVSEGARVNQTVLYLRAKDADHGRNAEIRYSLAAQGLQSRSDSFSIDYETGRLYVTSPLDREVSDKCQVVVSARDLGVHPRHANVLVTLHVEDINDNLPEISINSLSTSASNSASVPENAPPGTFIAHLTAVDRDLGENGTVHCYLHGNETNESSPGMKLFHLEKQRFTFVRGEQEYHLLTAAPLDREATQRHQVDITCSDEGRPPLSSCASIEISVADENDNSPAFSSREYQVAISEISIPGSIIVRLSASDPDAGKNGKVSYGLSGPLAKYFDVDSTGNLIISQHLDREKLGANKLEVIALDHGEPQRTGTTLLIFKTDLDLQASNSTYIFKVLENQQPGTKVGRVGSGAEHDEGLVTFRIEESQESHVDAFAIDPETGCLATKQILDRESHPVHRFWVHLLPSEGTNVSRKFVREISVTVFVEDVNDNDPSFVFPSPGNSTVVVSRANFKAGALVARVRAVDRDSGRNAEIKYKLQSSILTKSSGADDRGFSESKAKLHNASVEALPNSTLSKNRNITSSESHGDADDEDEDEVLSIDSDLGDVTVKRSPNLRGDFSLHLTVVAMDTGDPERSSSTLLSVLVRDSNVTWFANVRISGRTVAVLGFMAGTCLVVSLLTALLIFVVLFKRYSKRQPMKLPSQATNNNSSCSSQSIKNSSSSSNSLLSFNFSVISGTIRCLTSRSCLPRESRHHEDLLRRSVPCIRLSIDQGPCANTSSKLLDQSSDAPDSCAVHRSPQRTPGHATRRFDSTSYVSLEPVQSSETQHEAGRHQSRWRQKFLQSCPRSMTFQSSRIQNRGATKTNSVEISHQSSKDDDSPRASSVVQSSEKKVVFRCGNEGRQRMTRDRKDLERQIERLRLPPPAQLPPHATHHFNDSILCQAKKRPARDDKSAFMSTTLNVERHKIPPFRLNALKQVEESEII